MRQKRKKRLRDLRIGANMLHSSFSKANECVKSRLFSTYFNQIYCLRLCIPVTKKLQDKARVTINNCFRKVFGKWGIFSVSREFQCCYLSGRNSILSG